MKFLLIYLFLSLSETAWEAGAEVLLLRREIGTDTELSCVYNGPQDDSVGLGWVLPGIKRPLNQTYKRWKQKSRQGLVKHEVKEENWSTNSSLHFTPPNILPPVLDERWNSFPEVWTEGDVYSESVFFTTDRVHVSVLARGNAYIAISTSPDPISNTSYLLTVDTEGEKHVSELRRCVTDTSQQHSDCQFTEDVVTGKDVLRSGSKWVHLTLQLSDMLSGGVIRIQLSASTMGNDSFLLLNGTDRHPIMPLSSLKYLSFRTEGSLGRWRVHNYEMMIPHSMIHSDLIHTQRVSEKMSKRNYTTCLHFFYFLAPGFGHATVTTKGYNESIILLGYNTWQSLKVEMALKGTKDQIIVSPPARTLSSSNLINFALSTSVRICGDREYSVSKIVVNDAGELNGAKCVELTSLDYAVLQNTTQSAQPIFACAKHCHFGSSCNLTCGKTWGDVTWRGRVVCDNKACSCFQPYISTDSWQTTCTQIASRTQPVNHDKATTLPPRTSSLVTPSTSQPSTVPTSTTQQEVEELEEELLIEDSAATNTTYPAELRGVPLMKQLLLLAATLIAAFFGALILVILVLWRHSRFTQLRARGFDNHIYLATDL